MPQDAKLSTLAPEPCEPLEIMEPPLETLMLKCYLCWFTVYRLFKGDRYPSIERLGRHRVAVVDLVTPVQRIGQAEKAFPF